MQARKDTPVNLVFDRLYSSRSLGGKFLILSSSSFAFLILSSAWNPLRHSMKLSRVTAVPLRRSAWACYQSKLSSALRVPLAERNVGRKTYLLFLLVCLVLRSLLVDHPLCYQR